MLRCYGSMNAMNIMVAYDGAGDTLVLDLGTFPVIKLSVGVR